MKENNFAGDAVKQENQMCAWKRTPSQSNLIMRMINTKPYSLLPFLFFDYKIMKII